MRCSLAGQYNAKLNSSCAQTCDHMVHSMSSTSTMFSIEETQAKEGHCAGKTLKQEAAEKARAALASYKALPLK